jgi:hypothetical protein
VQQPLFGSGIDRPGPVHIHLAHRARVTFFEKGDQGFQINRQLAHGAANALGLISSGVADVKLEVLESR